MTNPERWEPCHHGDLLASPTATAMSRLFEHLPDTYFFLKDRESRFVHANRALLERLGLRSVDEIIGTTDHDRYPPHVADRLLAGDLECLDSGEPLLEHADVLFDRNGRLEWFSTSKYPIVAPGGTTTGIVGITRSYSNRSNPSFSNHTAEQAIDFICRNPTSELGVTQLAARFGISGRQLHRQFLALVRMSPRDFILRTRIQSAAADLRNTEEPLASLAQKYRFCDQSAFTRQFRKILGTTPAAYRREPLLRP